MYDQLAVRFAARWLVYFDSVGLTADWANEYRARVVAVRQGTQSHVPESTLPDEESDVDSESDDGENVDVEDEEVDI